MPSRPWKILSAVGLICTSTVAGGQAPAPGSIADQLSRPWRHVPNQVSDSQLKQDQAKCKVIAAQTPDIDEIKFDVVYLNCLRASGYEPVPNNEEPVQQQKSSGESLKYIALIPCSGFTKLTAAPTTELELILWGRGFIEGWNAAATNPILKVDPGEISAKNQAKFLEGFCRANPSKYYLEAIYALMAQLKFEKARRTGSPTE